jgi:UDP-glucose 4-epimerase
VAEANVLALVRGDDEAYNIGSGCPVSVNEIYRLLVEATGVRIAAAHGPRRVGDVRLFYFDCTKAGQELNWRPHTSFAEGIERTLAWYRAHAELQRAAPGRAG